MSSSPPPPPHATALVLLHSPTASRLPMLWALGAIALARMCFTARPWPCSRPWFNDGQIHPWSPTAGGHLKNKRALAGSQRGWMVLSCEHTHGTRVSAHLCTGVDVPHSCAWVDALAHTPRLTCPRRFLQAQVMVHPPPCAPPRKHAHRWAQASMPMPHTHTHGQAAALWQLPGG